MNAMRRIASNDRITVCDGWQFAAAPAGSTLDQLDQLDWIAATVPGTAASALRDARLWNIDEDRSFDGEDFWWRVQLDETGDIVLGFDGIATLADVWLDGNPLLSSNNMFVAHEIPLQLRGKHELLIRCRALELELRLRRPRPRWRVPMLREQQLRWFRTSLLGRTPGWSPSCPAVGPWRPVWIERRSAEVGQAEMQVRIEQEKGIVELAVALGSKIESALLIVVRGKQRFESALERKGDRWQGRIEIPQPDLWWPHTHGVPALYRVSLEARTATTTSVIELGQRGFRSIDIDREDGDFRISVNKVPVFCRGACWTPLDVVSLNAAAADYAKAVEQVRDAGMNMLRIVGPMVYENDALFDAMDRCGILLWQDLMFANMDYPEEPEFIANVVCEVEQQLTRLRDRPCLALVCGNSEGEQQAAMSSAAEERWSPPLFHATLAEVARSYGVEYTPSSAHGGAFPHAANHGASSYYGVGAYLRPLEDARRAEVRFASECLAFANIPEESGLPDGQSIRAHHPAWKARSPRDLGAGWDFDDVRDHYVQRLFDVDPQNLRVSDHERYLALGRAASGEAMARVFSEWRRARSPTRGALIWFLRDLWPGAGWGVIDANGQPKSCYFALRRALAPVAVSISDEGVNGLVVHACNDGGMPLAARLELSLVREGSVNVGHGDREIQLAAHSAGEWPATSFLDGFFDLSFAYRFGPPVAQLVRAALFDIDSGALLAEDFHFPSGTPNARELDVGLHAEVISNSRSDEIQVRVGSERFAQCVHVHANGFQPQDNDFHVAPGKSRTVSMQAQTSRRPGVVRGTVTALNSSASARFEIQ